MTTALIATAALLFSLPGCFGEDSCFIAGTPVATPSGDVPIESLRVGDLVLAYDEATGQVVESRVTHLFRHDNKPFQSLQLPNGQTLGVTGNHPIYAAGRYQRADELRADSQLLSLHRTGQTPTTTVTELTQPTGFGGFGTVYNITVEGQHNYFVAGILVHNKTPACSDEFTQFCECGDPGVFCDAAPPDAPAPDAGPADAAPADAASSDAM